MHTCHIDKSQIASEGTAEGTRSEDASMQWKMAKKVFIYLHVCMQVLFQ
jgi:hypothetical protein